MVLSAENGPDPASARSVSAGPVHGTNATIAIFEGSAGSPVGRSEWQGRGKGSHPNWLVRPRSSRCQIEASDSSGAA